MQTQYLLWLQFQILFKISSSMALQCGILTHSENCKDPERLGKFLLDNFYLKKEDFNYDKIDSVFIK